MQSRAQIRRRNCRIYKLRYYLKKAAANRSAGLTAHGRPRRYQVYPEIHHLHGIKRRHASNKLWRQAKAEQSLALGLTRKGKPRQRRRWNVPTSKEREWRQLRESMNIQPAPELFPTLGRYEIQT